MRLRPAVLCLALAAALPLVAHAERGFDVRDMLRLDRYSSPLLTADGSLLYAHRATNAETMGGSTALWLRPAAGGEPRRVTPADWSVSSPTLSADGGTVYFLSGKSGSNQLYSVPLSGGAPKQLTAMPVGVDGYVLSPDNRQVALAMSVFPQCKADLACTVDRSKAAGERKTSGELYDSLFVRHWDTWSDGRMNRVFVTRIGGDAPATTGSMIATDVVGDIPSKPFGDLSDLAWSPDGRQLAVSIRPETPQQPWSTNFDIYLVNADGSGSARNLTEANKAWDAGPVFSHDGRTLYYWAMKRPGFEADRHAPMAMDLDSGRVREIAPNWDRSVNGLTLSADGKTLYATAQSMGERPLFAIDIASGNVKQLVAEGSVGAFDVRDGRIAFARNTLSTGDQLFVANADGSGVTAASRSAGEMAGDVRFGDFEQFSFTGWNGNTVHGYLVKPWNWEEGKDYPVAFLIHGGPQGSFSNSWSYRWNPQTYAGQGYAVVMIDFVGSTGYGQAFTDGISGHWGDRPLEDLQKGWAAAQKQYPWLDGDRACALGASYGGYMTNWIAGNWFNADGSAPFKCLVTHNGVFDTRSMGLVTEELWFTEWEFGGTVWDKPEAYERFNPARHVGKWKTPTLIVGGNLDFRVPIDQSISAFTALQRKGVESQFLYFPDENHWVLKPHNSVQWHDTVNAWLKRHIGQ
ncbi:MAG: S9 family peptidase [Pseudoxanthomonas suwonensis]|nr:S9 family peptidase [Pseudoxanthomonas suwonensis]